MTDQVVQDLVDRRRSFTNDEGKYDDDHDQGDVVLLRACLADQGQPIPLSPLELEQQLSVENEKQAERNQVSKQTVRHLLVHNIVNRIGSKTDVYFRQFKGTSVSGGSDVHFYVSILDDPWNVEEDDANEQDDGLAADVPHGAKTGGVERFADGDVPVGRHQNHHPDGAQLDRVRQRPRDRSEIVENGQYAMRLTEVDDHCRVDLNERGHR